MPYRLLVVSGEQNTLRTLAEQMGDDIEVQFIETANDALWEVRSNPPEVILAAVDLPGMSGLEIAEIIPNFDVPTQIVLWSLEPDRKAEKQAEQYGVYRLLCGAVTASDLHAVLREAANKALMSSAAPPTAPDSISATPHIPSAPPEPAPPGPASVKTTIAPTEEAPVAARVRLSSRQTSSSRPTSTRAVEQPKPAAEPTPTPIPPSPPIGQRRRDGPLVLTADNLTPIRNIMGQLGQELGAQCIMLTDRAGMVLVEFGTTANLPMMILLPLLSTSFSTAGEVARQLHEEDATTLYIYEGVNYDLYCFDVLQRFLFVLVFNKKVASSKIGAVWINTKRAIRELRDILS